jgi:transcriptional regulator with XRE-family HTH domain
MKKAVFEIIKEIRKDKNISQVELAKKLNTTQSYIAQVESGNRKLSQKSLQKIFKALNVPDDEILSILSDENFKLVKLSEFIIRNKKDLKNLSEHIFLPYRLSYELVFIKRELSAIDKEPEFYAYIMPDDSMSPEINEDDILIIHFLDFDFLSENSYLVLDSNPFVTVVIKENTGIDVVDEESGYIRKAALINLTDDFPISSLNSINPEHESFIVESEKKYTKFKRDNTTGKMTGIVDKFGEVQIKGIVVAVIKEKIIFPNEWGI